MDIRVFSAGDTSFAQTILVKQYSPSPRRSAQPGCNMNVATATKDIRPQGTMRFMT